MKTITRHILWGGLALGVASLTCGTGCGNGFAVSNEPVNEEDAAQTADGSYTPSDAGTDSLVPETADESYMQDSDASFELQMPGLVPLLPLQEDDTRMEGSGFYCIRMRAAGSTHFGVYVDASVSDTDGINEMGLAVYGERYMERFLQSYPEGAVEAAYSQRKRNFGVNGDADLIALYAVDENGVETQFGLDEISCEELEGLL